MTANVRLWIDKSRIVGNASIENLDFKLIESKIDDVDQSVFGDLGLFGAEFLVSRRGEAMRGESDDLQEKLLTEILQVNLLLVKI